jgi:hypothetical protein
MQLPSQKSIVSVPSLGCRYLASGDATINQSREGDQKGTLNVAWWNLENLMMIRSQKISSSQLQMAGHRRICSDADQPGWSLEQPARRSRRRATRRCRGRGRRGVRSVARRHRQHASAGCLRSQPDADLRGIEVSLAYDYRKLRVVEPESFTTSGISAQIVLAEFGPPVVVAPRLDSSVTPAPCRTASVGRPFRVVDRAEQSPGPRATFPHESQPDHDQPQRPRRQVPGLAALRRQPAA